jgi:hypothetical protein
MSLEYRPEEPRVDDEGTIHVSFTYDTDFGRICLVRNVDMDAFDNILAELNPQETS